MVAMKHFSNGVVLCGSLFITALLAQSANASCDDERFARAIEMELPHLLSSANHGESSVRESSVRDLGFALARLGRTERALGVVKKKSPHFEDENGRSRDEVLRLATRRLTRRDAAMRTGR